MISWYKVSEINIIWVQIFSFCLVVDCWLISSRYVYNVSSIMIKDIDARIIIPTNNGFLLGEALLELWLHDELELVPEFTSFLTSSMETEKEKYIQIYYEFFLIFFENQLYTKQLWKKRKLWNIHNPLHQCRCMILRISTNKKYKNVTLIINRYYCSCNIYLNIVCASLYVWCSFVLILLGLVEVNDMYMSTD